MQIFITRPDYNDCARDLDDQRLNKIIVESAQICSTALWINDCNVAESLYSLGLIYLPTHEHHPLCRWCSDHFYNYIRAINYGVCLANEYLFRFDKLHKTKRILLTLSKYTANIGITKQSSNHINCTTNHKHIDNLYEAYKQELCLKWSNSKKHPVWTKRDIPDFYKPIMA